MCVCVRERLIDCREFVHTVVGAGKSEICRADQQAGDLRKRIGVAQA